MAISPDHPTISLPSPWAILKRWASPGDRLARFHQDVFESKGGGVRGTVEDCGSAIVVLKPQTPHPEPQFIQTAQCSEGGRFDIANIRPGDYYALLSTNGRAHELIPALTNLSPISPSRFMSGGEVATNWVTTPKGDVGWSAFFLDAISFCQHQGETGKGCLCHFATSGYWGASRWPLRLYLVKMLR
jgi:hypothetical protein